MSLTLRTLEPTPKPVPPGNVVPLRLLRLRDAAWAGPATAALGELLAGGFEVAPGFVVAAGAAAPPAVTPRLRSVLHAAYDALCEEAGDRALPVTVRPCGAKDHAEPPGTVARSLDALVEGVRKSASGGSPVLVQALVCGEAAALVRGDPADPSRLLVESTLGCRLVAGQPPDRFLVDRASGAVLGAQAVHKALRLQPGDGAWVTEPVPADQAQAPSLTHEEAARLAELAVLGGEFLGAPHALDAAVEWRRSSRRIRILGVRPVTPQASP